VRVLEKELLTCADGFSGRYLSLQLPFVRCNVIWKVRMPELPELAIGAQRVNGACADVQFTHISLHNKADTPANCHALDQWQRTDDEFDFKLVAAARGKETRLQLRHIHSNDVLRLVCKMGLVGKFVIEVGQNAAEKTTHTKGIQLQLSSGGVGGGSGEVTLTLVDALEFGSVCVGADVDFDWTGRSPDPTQEFVAFKRNILNNLDKPVFNRPICEALLDQRFFNGIGNYLRAEIMHRARVDPFAVARTVLRPPRASFFGGAPAAMATSASASASRTPKILDLCRDLPLQVIAIRQCAAAASAGGGDKGANMCAWFQCYKKDDARRRKDANNRTVWYY
jgi:endonuclease VIII-like 1